MAEVLLQRIVDQGRFEIGEASEGEQHVCIQSEDESPSKPKQLVIHFTRDATTQKPRGFQPTSGKKPVPFLYMSDKAVPWKYALKNLMEGRTSPLEITNPLPKLLTSLARAV